MLLLLIGMNHALVSMWGLHLPFMDIKGFNSANSWWLFI